MATVNLDVYTKTHGSAEKLKEVEGRLDGVEKKSIKAGDAIKGFGKAATIMGGAIVGAFAMMIKSASEAEEIESKFFAVFKEESESATAYIDKFAAATGRSRVDLMEWMGTLQDTFVPLGFARAEANTFSQTLTTLAVDLASFNNQAEPDVIRNLQSAIVGSHESVRKYGVVITQATINQELMNMGLEDGVKHATEAQKAQARLNIIVKSTSDAQGDAERTSGSFANQLKALQAQARDLSVAIGQQVLPMVSELIQKIVAVIKKVLEWMKAHPELAKKIAKTALVVGALLLVLGPILMMLPSLAAGIGMVAGAFGLFGGALIAVVAAATAAYIIFKKLQSAKEELAAATERADAQEKRLIDKLKEAADAAGMTRAEFHQLSEKYHGNAAAMAMAIKHGKEGVAIQESLAAVGKKNVEQWKKVEEAQHKVTVSLDPNLTGAMKNAGKKTKELTKLIKKMTDEVKKHTLDEFTYRKEKALEIYNERLALLKKESADKGAYVLAEQAYNAELKAIEDDRTEKIRDANNERGQIMADFFQKQRDLMEQAEGLHAGYTDEVMRLTKTESEYKLWALDEWYRLELLKLEDLKDNYEAYTLAKSGLDEAFAAKTIATNLEITQQIGEHWQMLIDGLAGSFGGFVERVLQGGTSLRDNLKMLWEDVKSSFISVIADMARQWMADFIKQLITGAITASTSITASIGTAVSTITTGLGSIVTAVGAALVSIAQAIATAATILASAAAQLAAVGLIAIALYAAFMLVKGIIAKLLGGAGAGDVVYWLKAIREVGERISWGTDSLGEIRNFTKRLVKMRDILGGVEHNTANTVRAVNNLGSQIAGLGGGGAQAGAIIDRPSLMMVGEKAPAEKEFITPEPMMRSIIAEAAAGRGGQVKLTIQNEFRIEGQVDPNFTQRFVREQVMPQMADALDTNYMKTLIKEKLGI